MTSASTKNRSAKSLPAKPTKGKEALGTVKQGAITIGVLVAIFWIVEIVDQVVFGGSTTGLSPIDRYGIYPRTISGLKGIVFAPFLHGGWDHLISNTVPFAAMGGLIYVSWGRKQFMAISLMIVLLAGLGTWLIGNLFDPKAVHIGASGVIFGYLGFLLASGIFERSFKSIALAVVVGGIYGGVIGGVLPGTPGVSWEGHLSGLLGGGYTAYLFAQRRAKAIPKNV